MRRRGAECKRDGHCRSRAELSKSHQIPPGWGRHLRLAR